MYTISLISFDFLRFLSISLLPMSLLDRTTFFITQTSYDEAFIRASIDELRSIIKEHNERYYLTSDPLISDVQYDQLFALLKEREDQFPDLVVGDSPTQRLVGQTIE